MNIPDSISINGTKYNAEELRQQAQIVRNRSNNSWETDLWKFIDEWVDPVHEHITVYTSGSTGNPKKIEHSKQKMIASARRTCDFFSLNDSHTALLCLPPDKIGGMMMLVRAFVSGMDLIVKEPSGHPFQDIASDIDFTAIVPTQLYNSLNQVELD